MRSALLLALVIPLAAAMVPDHDFDGVSDQTDQCPHTPFEALVDATGCPFETDALQYEIALGGGYASGDYGTGEEITSLSTEMMTALYTERFFASAALSYFFQGGYDPSVSSRNDGGVSDTYLSGGYRLSRSRRLELIPSLQLKLPTAADGLGTGAVDVGAALQCQLHFDGADLFALGGYTKTGDTAEYDYNDIAYYSAGAAYNGDSTYYGSISYDYSQSYVPGNAPIETVSLFGAFALYDTLLLRVQYAAGLSSTTARHAASLSIVKRF